MKVELFLDTPESVTAFADFLVKHAASEAAERARMAAATDELLAQMESAPAAEKPAEKPVEKAPAKRGRKPAEKAPDPTPAPAAPEDDIFGGSVEADTDDSADDFFDDPAPAAPATLDDVKIVVERYINKYGMPEVQRNGPKLIGYKNLSAIPNDPTVYAEVIARFEKAIASGTPNG